MNALKVLVACEESQRVCMSFRELGHEAEKKTCLWLKGLPKLTPTNEVKPPERVKFASGKTMPKWYADAWHLPKEERSKLRSQTFGGIAKAMAEQWSKYIEEDA